MPSAPYRRVVVMGVAGAGKTTVGRALADALGAAFVDADDLHPAANVARMAAGVPLTDDDRWPWLDRVADALATPGDVVVACSALRRAYCDRLRSVDGVRFVFLDLDAPAARARAEARTDHFMGPAMVASQFDALERPAPDEPDVVTLDATGAVGRLVADALAALAG